tara:strand:- start:3010 stop:3258 length:249 start_codon:yes stop_codon:yes gene_type:complete
MTKQFSSSTKLNLAIDRASKRRRLVGDYVNMKLAEYDAKFPNDSTSKYAYMTGYLTSILGSVAQSESTAELRRVFEREGVKL